MSRNSRTYMYTDIKYINVHLSKVSGVIFYLPDLHPYTTMHFPKDASVLSYKTKCQPREKRIQD